MTNDLYNDWCVVWVYKLGVNPPHKDVIEWRVQRRTLAMCFNKIYCGFTEDEARAMQKLLINSDNN